MRGYNVYLTVMNQRGETMEVPCSHNPIEAKSVKEIAALYVEQIPDTFDTYVGMRIIQIIED